MNEFRERMLVALFVTADTHGLGSFLDPTTVADNFQLDRKPGQLRLAVQELDARGLIKADYYLGGGDEGGINVRITSRGVEEAEELLESNPEYANPIESAAAPASDRYVTLTDNQRSAINADLEDLRRKIASSNEADQQDRDIAISEIAVFEITIVQSKVSTELIERFAKRIVGWLLKTFGDALIGAAAAALIDKLIPFLNT